MTVHLKTDAERRAGLEELVSAISAVVAWIEASWHFVDAVPVYRTCRQRATELLEAGFDQPALDALSRSVPRLIHLHPHWTPPLIESPPGHFATPPWFDELTPLHARLVAAADQLRVIGVDA